MLEARIFSCLRFSSIKDGFSTRSLGGYPIMESSGKTAREQPSSLDFEAASRIRELLSLKSEITGFVWQREIFI